MFAVPMQQPLPEKPVGVAVAEEEEEGGGGGSSFPEVVRLKKDGSGDGKGAVEKVLQLRRPGYMYREGNWEIGRAAEKAGVRVREYKPGNRWLAWRKRALRRKRRMERRNMFRRAAAGKKVKRRR